MNLFSRITGMMMISLAVSALSESALANITVNPITVEINGDADGVTYPFELTVTTFGPNTIKASLVEIHQKRNGDMGYKPLAPNDPDIATVKFDKAEQTLQRPGKLLVSGVVHLTSNLMRHKRFLGIYVVENPPKEHAGRNAQIVQVKLAYLLPIHTPRIEKDSALRGLFKYTGLTKQNGLILLNGTFANPAADITKVTSEVTVRDAHNHLVERIKLNSPVTQAEAASGVYPRTEVDFVGPSTKITKPGVYNFSYLGKLNNKRPLVVSRKMTVTPEMLDNSHFDVSPVTLDIPYRQGQRYAQKVTVVNPQSTEITAIFESGKTGGSGLTETSWNKKEVLLPPHSSTVMSFSVNIQDKKEFAPKGVTATFKDKETGRVLQVTPFAVTFVESSKSTNSTKSK